MKKDKVYYGLISGVIAGTIQNIISLIVYSLDITTLRYLDWMAIMLYGHPPETILDGAFALLVQLGLTGFIGVVAVYLLPILKFEHYLVKGAFIGVGFFQFFYFITALFKVPGLQEIPTNTVISNFTIATVYGLILSILIKKWVYNLK